VSRSLRNTPLVIAAAALIAAPAVADPVPLNVPVNSSPLDTVAAPGEPEPAAQVEIPPEPAATAPVVERAQTSASEPAREEPVDLRPTTPLPSVVSVEAPPPPPPPPPPAPPPPPPPQRAAPPPRPQAAPTQRAEAPATSTAIGVRVGVQENYTRLSFQFGGPTTVTPTLAN